MGVVLSGERIVPAWLAALEHLGSHGGRARNVVLEVQSPTALTAGDRAAVQSADAALRSFSDTSIATVAGTIFPQGMYLRHGADGLAKRFMKVMSRAKKRGTWGTYAMRMMERPGRAAGSTFYPLEQIIAKMRRAATEGVGYTSICELGVHYPEDLDETHYEFACELPTIDPARDGAMVSNMPCLSHVTFKLIDKQAVELTAIYRSHWYLQRALGNLIGLSHLQSFVAKEAGLQVGPMTCISTDATLDYGSWGGATEGRRRIAALLGD